MRFEVLTLVLTQPLKARGYVLTRNRIQFFKLPHSAHFFLIADRVAIIKLHTLLRPDVRGYQP